MEKFTSLYHASVPMRTHRREEMSGQSPPHGRYYHQTAGHHSHQTAGGPPGSKRKDPQNREEELYD